MHKEVIQLLIAFPVKQSHHIHGLYFSLSCEPLFSRCAPRRQDHALWASTPRQAQEGFADVSINS